ncbi:DMT family transporter [Pseudaminobacter sp. 19-2017]|uniref:DMT family transporter n=1 Tax=Pseudaminobacter soli (ex Zhang et al. 2022) TaxID=2831468 RepID=A0A942DYD4_9HYPH|nr:DMT family transporter [Pseudaminobacter soli]MBS3647753.1 DMT family transporter [Pseudaminobacter soli]
MLLLTTLFWAGNAVAGKLAAGHISPMLLTAMRWALALAILLAIGWRQLRADVPALKPKLLYLLLLGFLGFAVFNIALYGALVYTTAINVSIEQGAIPMLIFLLNFLFFRVRATALQLLGLLMSVTGILLTASHGSPARLLQFEVNVGDAIMVLGVVSYGAYTVLLRYRPAVRWQSLMIVLVMGGLLGALPFAAAEYRFGALVWPDTFGWAILAYVAIFPSILAQVFFIRGVEMIGANRAGRFVNLVPILGTLLSIVIVGEAFQAYHAVALALVLGGIALRRGRRC